MKLNWRIFRRCYEKALIHYVDRACAWRGFYLYIRQIRDNNTGFVYDGGFNILFQPAR